MQWFYNLKISAKLIISFLLVLSLTSFLGIFSIVQLAKVNQTSTDMEINWMPSVRTTSDMNTNTSDFRIAELQHVLSISDEEMAKYEQAMTDVTAVFDKNRAEYEKLISSPEEKELWDSFTKEWDKYLIEHGKMTALSRANKNDEAKALMRGNSQQYFDTASANLLKLVNLNVEGGKAASRAGDVLYSASRTWIISLLVAALVIGLGLALFIARIVSRPLDIAVKLASAVASGNLTSKVEATTQDETGKLIQALNDMQTNLRNLISQIQVSADAISSGTQQISAGNTDLSSRTEEQASSLEETASSMEEMASTVKQNAENAKQANVMAREASGVAVKGGAVVNEVVNTMAEINTSSKKIVDIISVIDGIAFQTNILALNAAVEAARAGEQGRGFAVVAAEVRSLAQRSAAAAKEIKQLIGDSVEKVQGGTQLVGEAGKTMEDIVASVKKVTDIVNEIAAASQEQSAGIDQVNNAITQMDEVTQQNAALVEEAAAAASSLEAKAQELTDATNMFNLGDSRRTLGHQSSGAQSNIHRNDLNEIKTPRPNELPSAKANAGKRLKAPKAKADESKDWEEF